MLTNATQTASQAAATFSSAEDTAIKQKPSASLQARGIQASPSSQHSLHQITKSIEEPTAESIADRGVTVSATQDNFAASSQLTVRTNVTCNSVIDSGFGEFDEADLTSISESSKAQIENSYSKLGSGAHGSVYLIKDGPDRPDSVAFAFKTTDTLEGAQTLLNEAKIYEMLDAVGPCENIVQCVGIREIEGTKGLAMEYVNGCEVSELLGHLEVLKEDGFITHSEYWGAVQYLAKDMLTALDHMQKAGLSHNDVKGSNMFYDKENGALKLFDFGGVTKVGVDPVKLNTPNYAAPEALLSTIQDPNEDDSITNDKQDSFSVGQIVYRTGEGESHFFGSKTSWSGGGAGLAWDLGEQLGAIQESGDYDNYKTLRESAQPDQAGAAGLYGIGGGGTAYVDFVNSATKLNPEERAGPAELLQKPFITDTLLQPEEAQALLSQIAEGIIENKQREAELAESEDENDFESADFSDSYEDSMQLTGGYDQYGFWEDTTQTGAGDETSYLGDPPQADDSLYSY